jgi:hypothetical protein
MKMGLVEEEEQHQPFHFILLVDCIYHGYIFFYFFVCDEKNARV